MQLKKSDEVITDNETHHALKQKKKKTLCKMKMKLQSVYGTE